MRAGYDPRPSCGSGHFFFYSMNREKSQAKEKRYNAVPLSGGIFADGGSFFYRAEFFYSAKTARPFPEFYARGRLIFIDTFFLLRITFQCPPGSTSK
jgi:hypothetical protein